MTYERPSHDVLRVEKVCASEALSHRGRGGDAVPQ
jgi:hypothetical protein